MYKLINKFPKSILLLLYFSLIYPYLIYCVTIWGNSPASHIRYLIINQNSFLRIIFNVKKHDHITHYYIVLKLLSIRQLYLLHLSLLTYKLWILKYHIDFYNFFQSNINNSLISLRHKKLFYISKSRTNLYNNSTFVTAMRLWNFIQDDCRSTTSIPLFKGKIKSLIWEGFFTHFN